MDKKAVEELNLKVLSRQVKNIDRILYTASYAALATYDINCNHWSYLAFKGPLFLVQDKLEKKKLVILNQCNDRDYILPVHENYKFELKQTKTGEYMMNYSLDDTISGLIIKGIWSQDSTLKDIYHNLIH